MTWKHRYTVLGILFCAYLLCYLDRMVMASAIPFIARDFKLSPLSMGSVLSAFFVGYALMQIPGGLLADRFGPRKVLTGSIAWFSVMTAFTGMVPGLTAMLILRVLFGLGEGPYPSAASKAVSSWFPPREIGRANGLQLAASCLGATMAPLFGVALIVHWGWRSVFYALFIPGLASAGLVWRYVRDSPAQSPWVGREELNDYERGVIQSISVRKSLLRSLQTPAVRWCALSLFLANIVNWGVMNWLPTYLLQARGFGAEKMSVFAALTNLAGALGYPLGGYLCDRYFGGNLRVPIVVGLLSSAGFTYLAAEAPSGEAAVIFLMPAFLLSTVSFTGLFTLPLVLVPKEAVGGAFGIVNTAGQLAGVLSPLLVGALLEATQGSFKIVLYVMVALTFVAVFPAIRIRQEPLPVIRSEAPA